LCYYASASAIATTVYNSFYYQHDKITGSVLEENNFIACTAAVQLMIFPKQTKWRNRYTNEIALEQKMI
jgi:hypothetical protein